MRYPKTLSRVTICKAQYLIKTFKNIMSYLKFNYALNKFIEICAINNIIRGEICNNTSGKAINIMIVYIFLVNIIMVKQTNKNVYIFFFNTV